MLAQFGVRQRFGWKGVVMMAVAGIAPNVDTATKLVSDREFWRLHHALGHGLIPIAVLSGGVATAARWLMGLRPVWLLWVWCLAAAAAHVATDAIYWWGVQPLWPFSRREFCLAWIEYLDLFVLAIWLCGGACLYFSPSRGQLVATLSLAFFAAYLAVRAMSPAPAQGSLFHLVTGGWMYAAPKGDSVLDWW
jgi:membrane-bound metal-dependent hydrolase YbcI (DUF457 family)